MPVLNAFPRRGRVVRPGGRRRPRRARRLANRAARRGLRATLGFLEKLTLEPAAVTLDDAKAVFSAGVSEDALEDAIDVCALFNIIDRIADALGFELPNATYWKRVAPGFLAGGYVAPASPMS